MFQLSCYLLFQSALGSQKYIPPHARRDRQLGQNQIVTPSLRSARHNRQISSSSHNRIGHVANHRGPRSPFRSTSSSTLYRQPQYIIPSIVVPSRFYTSHGNTHINEEKFLEEHVKPYLLTYFRMGEYPQALSLRVLSHPKQILTHLRPGQYDKKFVDSKHPSLGYAYGVSVGVDVEWEKFPELQSTKLYLARGNKIAVPHDELQGQQYWHMTKYDPLHGRNGKREYQEAIATVPYPPLPDAFLKATAYSPPILSPKNDEVKQVPLVRSSSDEGTKAFANSVLDVSFPISHDHEYQPDAGKTKSTDELNGLSQRRKDNVPEHFSFFSQSLFGDGHQRAVEDATSRQSNLQVDTTVQPPLNSRVHPNSFVLSPQERKELWGDQKAYHQAPDANDLPLPPKDW
eukprot:g2503.t1